MKFLSIVGVAIAITVTRPWLASGALWWQSVSAWAIIWAAIILWGWAHNARAD